jgi:hypothetical protein
MSKIFSKLVVFLMVLLSFGFSVPSFAVELNIVNECSEKKSVKWWNFGTPWEFLPLVPEKCSTTKDGKPAMLNPALIPDMMIRAYSFVVSLAFWLIGPYLLYIGLRIILNGFTGGEDIGELRKGLVRATTIILTLAFFYVGLYQILWLFGVQELFSTDLKSFFSI